MSLAVFAHSPDFKQLRDEGYAASVVTTASGTAHLLLEDVPYVTPGQVVARGTLVASLGIVGNRAEAPADHTVHFVGETPSDQHGKPLTHVINSSGDFPITPELRASFYFSNKPADGSNFPNQYEKMTHYVRLLEAHAQSVDPEVTAQTFPPVADREGASPFMYVDSATSRAGTAAYAERLVVPKLAIVGLGGSGSYVLDLLSKTPVGEIHLFDGDDFLSHNAFRAPGAATLEELQDRPKKVDYHARRYGAMKRGIVAHPYVLTAVNVAELQDMNFVFLCMEGGTVKRQLVEALETYDLPFIDVGMGLQIADGQLTGALQVTTSTPGRRDHLRERVSLVDVEENDIYDQNIQIADLNSLNATLAVIKWKKLCGFYRDEDGERYSAYRLDSNEIINEVLEESRE